MSRLLSAALGATAWAGLAGCSSLESSSDTWQSLFGEAGSDPPTADTGVDTGMTDAGAMEASPPPAGSWSCKQGVEPLPVPPLPAGSPTGKVRYRVAIVDLVYSTPIPGLTIKSCPLNDTQCAMPVTAAYTIPDPKRPYVYQIEMPYGFIGYLRITATGYIPTEYFFNGKLVGTPSTAVDPDGTPFVTGEPIAMPSLAEINDDFLSQLGSVAYDPAKGLLAARTLDCNGKRARNVTLNLEPDSGAIGYTLIGNQPVHMPTPIPTDPTGSGGFANIPPYKYLLSGMLPAGLLDNDAGSYGRSAVSIKPGVLTITEIRTDDYTYGR